MSNTVTQLAICVYVINHTSDKERHVHMGKRQPVIFTCVFEQRIGLAGQRSFGTPKVPGSIPDLAVSMQLGFMLKMEVLCALTCP